MAVRAREGARRLQTGQGPVIVNASCNFLMPLVYPGDVEVRMYLGDPGRTSVGSYYEICTDGRKYADGASRRSSGSTSRPAGRCRCRPRSPRRCAPREVTTMTTTTRSGNRRRNASRRRTSRRSPRESTAQHRRRRRHLRAAVALVGRPQGGLLARGVGLRRRASARRATACCSTRTGCRARAGFRTRGSTSRRTCSSAGAPTTPATRWCSGARTRSAPAVARASCTRWRRASRRRSRRTGVAAGDRVAAYLPNMPEAIVAMLGADGRGAIWSSCSPDFGVQGVLDRFGQIEPRVLFTVDGYWYNGKPIPILDKVAAIVARLPSVERVVVVPYLQQTPGARTTCRRCAAPSPGTSGSRRTSPGPIDYAALPFDHPLYILYSSGTTGVPKCIVHGAGGTLLQHLKEHRLHGDVKPGDRLFYFTTCGWMMWNWLVSGLGRARDAAAVRRLAVHRPRAHPVGARRRRAHDALRHVGQVHRRAEEDRAGAAQGLRASRTRAHDVLDRQPAGARELRLRLPVREGATCACRRSPAAPTSCRASRSARRRCRCGAASCSAAASAWTSTSSTRTGRPVGARPRASSSASRRSRRCRSRFWNDPDGAKYRAAYFERFPGRLVPRRLGRDRPSTTGSSSTGAPTRRSIRAACASAPRRSTGRSSSCPRSSRAS